MTFAMLPREYDGCITDLIYMLPGFNFINISGDMWECWKEGGSISAVPTRT